VAFLRFSRDKRGYEHFYLMQPTNRRGKSQPRVLYWFRSPPNVRVGREPFDAGVRRALEAQNPGVAFDWKTIVETPIPSGDTERWRERRRAEKAIRHAVAEDEAAEIALVEQTEDRAGEPAATIDATTEEMAPAPVVVSGPAAPPAAGDESRRKRRRRRGRRGTDVGRAPQLREERAPGEAPAPREALGPAEMAGPHEPVED
jgi:hypothetical protein